MTLAFFRVWQVSSQSWGVNRRLQALPLGAGAEPALAPNRR